ncbi:tRNA-intron lyase [Candidatus Pacearchaeota archaeon]|nr:tRNA-intron lyase [Candidatus Pacearchaeota archaeon]
MAFEIYFLGNQLFSNTAQAITLAKNKKLGEYKTSKVIYSKYEAFYLIEKAKAKIMFKEKKITSIKAIKLFSKKHKNFSRNYLVYKDLREKGYIVKTALKFGTEFRVYDKKSKHAKWLVFISSPRDKVKWKEFVSTNRISHSTAKKLLIALIDSQHSISYFESDWIKP